MADIEDGAPPALSRPMEALPILLMNLVIPGLGHFRGELSYGKHILIAYIVISIVIFILVPFWLLFQVVFRALVMIDGFVRAEARIRAYDQQSYR